MGVGQSFLMQDERYQSVGLYIFPINRQYSYNTWLVATLYWGTMPLDVWYLDPGTSFSGWFDIDVSSVLFFPDQTYTLFVSASSPYWGAQASSSNLYPDGRAYTLYGTAQQDLRFRVTTNSPTSVPEPASCLLLASGLLGVSQIREGEGGLTNNLCWWRVAQMTDGKYVRVFIFSPARRLPPQGADDHLRRSTRLGRFFALCTIPTRACARDLAGQRTSTPTGSHSRRLHSASRCDLLNDGVGRTLLSASNAKHRQKCKRRGSGHAFCSFVPA